MAGPGIVKITRNGGMRTLAHVSTALTAVVHIASMAVLLGALAAIYSQSIATGLLVAFAALIAGLSGFSYSVWKISGSLPSRPSAV
jgi:hypothetical protein